MNSMLLYFIKSAISMALFYGVYRVFMEKETNHTLNRFYLVGTIILSLVLPVLPLEKLFIIESYQMPLLFISGEQGIASAAIEISNTSGAGLSISGIFLARIIYLGGIGILALTLIAQMVRLFFIRRAGKERYGQLTVISVVKNILPFSILNRVFISQETREDPKLNTILDHEHAHFRLMHFIDLFLLEFITIFQWFNPIVWLYVRSLKEIHEYQADAVVLQGGEGTGTYQALLVNQLTGTEVFRLSSAFSKSLTKKRMIMMTKIKSGKSAWMKALIAMPVLAILLIAYAANSPAGIAGEGDYIVKGKVVEAETGDPLPGVSIIWQGTTSGTVSDMDGTFVLKVNDKDAVVVYSFVGFTTAKTTGEGEYTVKMDTKVYEVNTDYNPGKEKAELANEESPEKEPIKTSEPEEVFYVVEDMPKFQGMNPDACIAYVQENLEYPQKARDKGIEGKVYVSFVIDTKGKVTKAEVKRSVDPLLNKAALKAVNSMPAWTPGKQRGKAVQVQIMVPVEFKL